MAVKEAAKAAGEAVVWWGAALSADTVVHSSVAVPGGAHSNLYHFLLRRIPLLPLPCSQPV